VYAIIVNKNHNANNIDKFDVLASHSLTITSLHIYLTFIGMSMYVVGLFSQVTCAPMLISKSVQSENCSFYTFGGGVVNDK